MPTSQETSNDDLLPLFLREERLGIERQNTLELNSKESLKITDNDVSTSSNPKKVRIDNVLHVAIQSQHKSNRFVDSCKRVNNKTMFYGSYLENKKMNMMAFGERMNNFNQVLTRSLKKLKTRKEPPEIIG